MRYILLFILSAVTACATIHTADTPEWDDVYAKYLLCGDNVGDILQIPAGEATWVKTMKITKGIIVRGDPGGGTIIYDAVLKENGDNGVTDEAVFALNVDEPKQIKLQDIKLRPTAAQPTRPNPSASGSYRWGAIQIVGSSSRYVLERIDTLNLANHHIHTHEWGSARGVIADCTLVNNLYHMHLIRFQHSKADGRSYGNGPWENPLRAGTPEAFYVENCRLTASTTGIGTMDGFGARYVQRGNTTVNAGFGHHGTESTQITRAPRFCEIYLNRSNRPAANGTKDSWLDMRDGNVFAWGNFIEGSFNSFVKHNSYRQRTNFAPWFIADGTMLWDQNDTSDGAGTPGPYNVGTGANDGVFEGGTITSSDTISYNGGTNRRIFDTSKAWTDDQWVNYVFRRGKGPIQAVSGNTTSVTAAPETDWGGLSFAGYTITRLDNNQKSVVSSHVGNVLTTNADFFRSNFTGFTGQFILTASAHITDNGADYLILSNNFQGSIPSGPAGLWYELRKVTRQLDQTGMGQCTQITPQSPQSAIPHQNLNQQLQKSYYWSNLYKGSPYPVVGGYGGIIQNNRDFLYDIGPVDYNGTAGMRSGTKAQMLAITPTLADAAFWVTDEGSWNVSFSGTIAATAIQKGYMCEIVSVGTTDFTAINSPLNNVGQYFVASGVGTGTGTVKPVQGCLYVWDGDSWELNYVPYTYPHPLLEMGSADVTAPVLSSATINNDGSLLTLTFSENVVGIDASDFSLSGGLSLSNNSGNGLSWTFSISPAATYATAYTLGHTPDTAEDLAGNPLGSFSGTAVTNNTANPDAQDPTILTATIDGAGTTLTIVYSEAVTGVSLVDYALSGGVSLSGLAGTGDTRTATITPPAIYGLAYTLDYTPGGTVDLEGNPMAAIVDGYVGNGTSPPAAPEPSRAGRRGRKQGTPQGR